MTNLLSNTEVAMIYAEAGISIFPANNSTKKPAISDSWKEASTSDAETVKTWWGQNPSAAIGLDCGKSNIVVVDLDMHEESKNGVTAFQKLQEIHGKIDYCPRVTTPSGGRHLYFAQPVNCDPLTNATGNLPPGIDVRGSGGYVIACGSVMSSGLRYEHDEKSPRILDLLTEGSLQPPPQWLLETIRPSRVELSSLPPKIVYEPTDIDTDRLRAALYFIPADDRETWLKVGGALHDSGIPNAREIWDEWSQKSSKFNAIDQDKTWKSFDRQISNCAGIGTIFFLAKKYGFTERQHQSGMSSVSLSNASDWKEPRPLPNGLLPVLPFPPEILPNTIRPWVEDISDRMQCPPDFVAATSYAALGSVIGSKIGVRPQRNDDWLVTSNTWSLIVGRPGLMKSPAMAEALKPLMRIEKQAREKHDADMASYKLDLQAHDVAFKHAQKQADRHPERAREFFAKLHAPEQPIAKRLLVNDATYEKLGEIASENPNGVMNHRDEMYSLFKYLDQEQNSSARGFFLTGWNGTSGYVFDRISRGNKSIENLCLSMLGSIQPARLSDYISNALKGGSGDDGLIQRFGFSVWPDQSSNWQERDRYPDSAARSNAMQTFEYLDLLTPASIGAQSGDRDEIPYLRLDAAAADTFKEWRHDLEYLLRSDTLTPALESHFAKYRKLVPSLALINHLADRGRGPITNEAMLKALACAQYLETHARRMYASGSVHEATAAKAIVARIRKGDLPDRFTARDVHRPCWKGLKDPETIGAALDLLVEYQWIAARHVQTGGRPTTIFKINPRMLA